MGKYFKFLIYWLPPILWASGIFYLSSISGLASGLTVFWDVFWRKLFHATEFGILSLLFWRALHYGENVNLKKALCWSFLLTVLYAISDETHQYFVPNRECRLRDMGIDSLGVAAVMGVIFLLQRIGILKERQN